MRRAEQRACERPQHLSSAWAHKISRIKIPAANPEHDLLFMAGFRGFLRRGRSFPRRLAILGGRGQSRCDVRGLNLIHIYISSFLLIFRVLEHRSHPHTTLRTFPITLYTRDMLPLSSLPKTKTYPPSSRSRPLDLHACDNTAQYLLGLDGWKRFQNRSGWHGCGADEWRAPNSDREEGRTARGGARHKVSERETVGGLREVRESLASD